MAFIDLVSWPDTGKDVYAWRYPETNLTTYTQLLVHESQEAYLFSKGQLLGKFGAGKHTLNTENIPVLHNLFGIPFGKKNPFTAEVWFVNKRLPINIEWRISKCTAQFSDVDYVPIYACGQYGLKIETAEKFLIKLVGNLHQFTSSDISTNFIGSIEQNTKSIIVNYIRQNALALADLQGHLSEFSNAIKHSMADFFAGYGLAINEFFVTTVDIDESDINGKKIKEALSSRTAQNLAGYTWQQQQAMDIASNAVNNASGSGGMGGILGMAMLVGGLGNNNAMGQQMMQQPQYYQNNMMNNASQIYNQGRVTVTKTVFCSNCGKSYTTNSKFCPYCGDKYNPCPVCGADTDENAKRCISCGAVLPKMNANGIGIQNGNICPACGMVLQVGASFCPNCGKKVN